MDETSGAGAGHTLVCILSNYWNVWHIKWQNKNNDRKNGFKVFWLFNIISIKPGGKSGIKNDKNYFCTYTSTSSLNLCGHNYINIFI